MRYGIFFNLNAGNGNAEKLAKKCKKNLNRLDTKVNF